MYTVPNCLDCAAVTFLLDEAGVDYETVDISEVPGAREALAMLSGLMSVPQVYIDGKFCGQVAEIRHLVRTGRLTKLLGQPAEQ